MQRGLTVEVDLQALRTNLRLIKDRTKVPVIGVVKADAYGHGIKEVSKALEEEGVYALGVAYLSEGVRLRREGTNAPILVFFDRDCEDEIIQHNLTPTINSLSYAKKLSTLAIRHSTRIQCHINVDTGMGRLGIWYEDFPKLLPEIISMEGLKITGLMSHFSEAEVPDSEYSKLQIERFKHVCNIAREAGLGVVCHMANSSAVINYPESVFDAVRVGLILYGGIIPEGLPIRPVMTVRAPIIQIRRLPPGTPVSYGRTFITTRPTTAGVLPVGYADGLFRSLSNRCFFLYKGKKVPVIGRICMDLTIVDLTDIEDPEEGDSVTILGDGLTAEALAGAAGTISYEVFTSFGRNNTRIYRTEA
jgi:alanine racemase